MRIVRPADLQRLRAFLDTDRAWADYALGDLEPGLFQLTEWYGAAEAGALIALAMIYHGLRPPICFLMGDERGVEQLVARAIHLPAIGLSVRDEHLPALQRHYRIVEAWPMWKMALQAREFKPAATDGAVRLSQTDVPALQALYALGGGDAFSPEEVERGVFYGVWQAGQLIAAAGTHVVSLGGHIAALGNVMTHPDQRGRGLATRVTCAVVGELIDRGVSTIGLSVGRANAAAIRVYEKLGFVKHARFHEGRAIKLDLEIHQSEMELL
jgi:ribosomal protein S18 acetylase RimI-like enzyme